MDKAAEMRGIDPSIGRRPKAVAAGSAAILRWVPVVDLIIDGTYQRDIGRDNITAINKIAENFEWSKFSAVHVAPVEGGKFAVIDGQHRVHAAGLCGFSEVPCQIVQIDRAAQAAAFAAINGLVTKVTVWQLYKAALAAGEGWALTAKKVCADAGCRLMTYNRGINKKPGEIYSIRYIVKAIHNHGEAATTRGLTAIRQAPEHGDTPEAYVYPMLRPCTEAVAQRPWLPEDIGVFFDEFDIWAAEDKAIEIVKGHRRAGVKHGVSRYEYMEALVGDALDQAYPQRMALPSPDKGVKVA